MHEHRFRCEIRHLLKLGKKASEYLEKVAAKRGKAEADRMMAEARNQWAKGNRGEWKDWR